MIKFTEPEQIFERLGIEELEITPTREQYVRFIIHYTFTNGQSMSRREQIARAFTELDKEYEQTGSIVLKDAYMIEAWLDLKKESFSLGEILPEPTYEQRLKQYLGRRNLG